MLSIYIVTKLQDSLQRSNGQDLDAACYALEAACTLTTILPHLHIWLCNNHTLVVIWYEKKTLVKHTTCTMPDFHFHSLVCFKHLKCAIYFSQI